jgi:acetoacetyl-CoA synthetase
MPPVLWQPAAEARSATRLGEFMDFCEARTGLTFDSYDALWRWSTDAGLEAFWAAVWQFFDVRSSAPYSRVLDGRVMPGARWFEGARLNYAEHALRAAEQRGDEVALVGVSQTRDRVEVTWTDLADQVGRARAGLVRLGVRQGDRVAAYLPNIPETIVAFLAASSLGATWTSCAPEFGVQAVLDRFTQVEPTVLLAVEGYRYGRHAVSRVDELAAIRAGLPSLQATVVVPYPEPSMLADIIDWDELISSPAEPDFAQLAPDHPLYVLYSSGTTGLPKPIVHGHGGILLEHLKVLGLHADMRSSDRFFWFTTTGWMMWNYLVSGLVHGARLVLFDGDPNHAGPDTLWKLAADEGVTWFGVGSPFITACRRAGLAPAEAFDLSPLRAIGATGAPLPPDGFRWVYESVSPDVMLSPISGGTDVCSAFVGGSPLTPVWEGEIPTRYLACAVAAFDEDGRAVVGEQGELVITQPMPSMPVGFWGDTDGSRYRAAYFDYFPGVWRHGDWVTLTERGSCVITGRSDATLNRGGVRVGTAEIYRVAEAVAGVVDSLVVHLEAADAADPGTLVLFVVLAADEQLDDEATRRIRDAIRRDLSPRHVPDEVVQVTAIPTTLSGKKLELPVKKILLGAAADQVASRGALKDPAALDEVVQFARSRRGGV